jgi:predicted O-linked N-acetylglucosamine transferase (SPINDLY family)
MCRVPVVREAGDDLAAVRSAFSAGLQALEGWFEAHPTGGTQVVGSEQPFWLAYHEQDNRDILQRYGRLCARLMARWQDGEGLRPAATRRRAGARSGPRSGPMRVGIVSQYFRDHSVWQAIIKGWLQQLDGRRFALSAFWLGADQDGETAYARSRVVSFEQAVGGLRPWVERIRAAEPEVLLYPEIGMDPMTLKLASLRLAPVQAAAWGHPETSGLPSIDLYLSAQDFEPAGAQDNYTERLVALPHLGCYVEPSGTAASSQPPELAAVEAGGPLLLCPGTPFKYAPEHDWVFPAIARGLGRCRFVFFVHRYRGLSEKLRSRLDQAFRQAGVAFERHVIFVPWQRKAEFYGWLRRADVFLDTIGFSGFNTALQAIECGLPVVTREGRFMRGRLASGILKRMQLDELVAASEKDYVSLAVRLAGQADYRERIRAEIAARRGVLFNDRAPIAALEELLETLR